MLLPITTTFELATLGQVLRGLDALPFQQRRRDALGHDLLEVAHAGGFDALALRLLRFFLQAEAHGQRFLLGLLFGFDGGLQRGRELDVAQQNVLHRSGREG